MVRVGVKGVGFRPAGPGSLRGVVSGRVSPRCGVGGVYMVQRSFVDGGVASVADVEGHSASRWGCPSWIGATGRGEGKKMGFSLTDCPGRLGPSFSRRGFF